ncbi:MAG TPA: FtsX-like permease family protein [Vicinamibacteria bacterium]|nr:FtsX-like permease family protein [Vicinamibacteria bacterium]
MLKSHLKLALKVLRRRPFFTAVSLVGIGLTLLVLTVTTAVFDHVFAPYPPEVRQARTLLLSFTELSGDQVRSRSWPGYRFLDSLGRGLPGVERMSIASQASSAFSYLNGSRVRSYLKRTDGEFWRILAFDFVEGAPYGEEEVSRGSSVAVINQTTRDRFFGGGPALGRSLELDGRSYRVVGVVRDVPFLRLVPFADVWAPLTAQPGDGWRRELLGDMMGILLARSPADFPAIRAEFASRLSGMDLSGTPYKTAYARPQSLLDTVFEIMRVDRSAIGILAVLFFGFLALPVINLVNLNVSRALERASEIGVRRAFGASRRNLVAQFVLENVVLTLIGGLLAFAATELAMRVLTASALVPYGDFHVNLRIFGWALAFAVTFGVLSGAWPAWRLSRLHPVDALRGSLR